MTPSTDLTIPDLIDDPSASRQETRLAAIPELYRQTHERLAVELALHVEDAESIFAAYGYNPDQAADLMESPAFLAIMQRAAKEIQTSGLSFKTKAQLIAGELLPYAHDLATDPMVSAATRLASIQWAAKMAGFEPKEKEGDGKTGGGLTLSITFAGQAPQQVVSARETLTIEGN
jgi:hypothetical protein